MAVAQRHLNLAARFLERAMNHLDNHDFQDFDRVITSARILNNKAFRTGNAAQQTMSQDVNDMITDLWAVSNQLRGEVNREVASTPLPRDLKNVITEYTGGGKTKKRKTNSRWISHVRDYHKKHPRLSYKEAVIKAKPSYKKK